jgi:hypothetical protein
MHINNITDTVRINYTTMYSVPDLLKIAMKSQNNCIKMSDHGRLKSQT